MNNTMTVDQQLIHDLHALTIQYLEGLITTDEMANTTVHLMNKYGRV